MLRSRLQAAKKIELHLIDPYSISMSTRLTNRGREKSVNNDVGVTTDGGREMGVDGNCQAVMDKQRFV